MKLLTRDNILAAKLKIEKIYIPEWKGSVIIREPTAMERAEYELLCTRAVNDDEIIKVIRGTCAAKCLIDDDGKRIFTDDDIERLHKTSANALDRIIDVYRKISLVGDEPIENAAKN